MLKNLLNQKINILEKSMEPSLMHCSSIIMRKVILFYKPRRFDIVYFKKDGLNQIKRVVGLNNERVQIKKGILVVNGNKISEKYIDNEYIYDFPEMVIGKDELFLMGDNRKMSIDSRKFGPVKIKNILSFQRL
tara:strand:+ start:192 stop:590 length:399 start_codon:yes stop_codon:yes gene_type:complete